MILVIEDDGPLVDLLKFYIETEYHKEVKTAKDMQSSLSLLERSDIKLILLDCYLETKPCYELAKIIKEKNLPVVLMTASHKGEEIMKQMQLNVLLKKPFTLEELDAILIKNV